MDVLRTDPCLAQTLAPAQSLIESGSNDSAPSLIDSSRRLFGIICELVAFLVANVVKTDKEWREWGAPFIHYVLSSQSDDIDEIQQWEARIERQFLPVIGHGFAVWLDDEVDSSRSALAARESSNGNQDTFVVVSFPESRMEELLAPYRFIAQQQAAQSNDASIIHSALQQDWLLENTMREFLGRFFTHVTEHERYDAKARTIVARAAEALTLSLREFGDLEQIFLTAPEEQPQRELCASAAVVGSDLSMKQCALRQASSSVFAEGFRRNLALVPRASVQVSYRLWRVAFVAAGGGALLAAASMASVPVLVATITPLATSVGDLLAASVALDALSALACVQATAEAVFPVVWGAIGIETARRKMLKRYGELKDFALENLHISPPSQSVARISGCQAEDAEFEMCAAADEMGSAAESVAPVSLPVSNCAEGVDLSARQAIPVFILVSGHREKAVDERAVWGGDGLINVIDSEHRKDQQDSSTAEEVATKSWDDWSEVIVETRGWFRELIPRGDAFLLRWEEDLKAKLNESFVSMLRQSVTGKLYAKFVESLWQLTPIYPVKQALLLPKKSLSHLKDIDGIWAVAMDRAEQAGKLLAMTLLEDRRERRQKREQLQRERESLLSLSLSDDSDCAAKRRQLQSIDESLRGLAIDRPITLIGFGMGARLIAHMLLTLHSLSTGVEQEDVSGIVENVVLLGAPLSANKSLWQIFRSVVTNRLVNVYSRLDWLLAVLYRSKSWELGVAGLQPVHVLDEPETAEATMRTWARDKIVVRKSESGGSISASNSSAPPQHRWVRGFLSQVALRVRDEVRVVFGASAAPTSLFDWLSHGGNGYRRSDAEEGVELELIMSHSPPSSPSLQNEDLQEEEVLSMLTKERTDQLRAREKTRLAHLLRGNREIENVDATEILFSHSDYPAALPLLLKMIRLQ